jgi:hypothetical protein
LSLTTTQYAAKGDSGPFGVFDVPWQIFGKKLLFINEPPYQEWQHKHERDETPPRAERQRRANEA